MKIYKHYQNLPAMYYRRIGEISYQWNLVEVYLQTIVWHFLGLDYKRGRLLTYWPGSQSKIRIFQALTQKWVSDPELVAEIAAIAGKAESLVAARNKIVHGLWGHPSGSADRFLLHIFKMKQRITPRAERRTLTDLTEVSDEITALKNRLIQLHKSLGISIP